MTYFKISNKICKISLNSKSSLTSAWNNQKECFVILFLMSYDKENNANFEYRSLMKFILD